MDDEDIIREMAEALLSGMGYDVELASDGAEAIERYQEARVLQEPRLMP